MEGLALGLEMTVMKRSLECSFQVALCEMNKMKMFDLDHVWNQSFVIKFGILPAKMLNALAACA